METEIETRNQNLDTDKWSGHKTDTHFPIQSQNKSFFLSRSFMNDLYSVLLLCKALLIQKNVEQICL